jgi:hypothetical protein
MNLQAGYLSYFLRLGFIPNFHAGLTWSISTVERGMLARRTV